MDERTPLDAPLPAGRRRPPLADPARCFNERAYLAAEGFADRPRAACRDHLLDAIDALLAKGAHGVHVVPVPSHRRDGTRPRCDYRYPAGGEATGTAVSVTRARPCAPHGLADCYCDVDDVAHCRAHPQFRSDCAACTTEREMAGR